MAEKIQRVTLERIGPGTYRARGSHGGEIVIDGGADVGGPGVLSPMDVLLAAAASCSSMDVEAILLKQREPLTHLEVHAEGTRVDRSPAPFRQIKLRFVAHGGVDAHKLERAVRLAVEKYCSVLESLDDAIEIQHEAEALPAL